MPRIKLIFGSSHKTIQIMFFTFTQVVITGTNHWLSSWDRELLTSRLKSTVNSGYWMLWSRRSKIKLLLCSDLRWAKYQSISTLISWYNLLLKHILPIWSLGAGRHWHQATHMQGLLRQLQWVHGGQGELRDSGQANGQSGRYPRTECGDCQFPGNHEEQAVEGRGVTLHIQKWNG